MKNSLSRNLQSHLKIRVSKDYPWKLLSSLTEDHRYCLTESDLSEITHVTRLRDYESYLTLSEAWGPQSINPCDTPDLIKFRTKYQVSSLLKKFRFSSGSQDRKAAAKKKFLAAEAQCKDFNLNGFKVLRCLHERKELRAFTFARDFLSRLLGVLPSEEELTLWSRHGPGANLDTKNGHNSQYFKYSEWPYSCTNNAYGHARSAIAADERWLGALEDDYRSRYNIPKTAILDQDMFFANVLNVVDGNRIAFVPKNSQTDRSIAIEPSINLYLQLGVDGFIRRRLKRWGVDLDCQKKNQRLALEGSKNWQTDDPFVTLDLAAASDTISLKLCEMLLPSSWYHYLLDLRSDEGVLEGEIVSYEKISSMGNGFTFALESAIFASVIYGCTKAETGSFDKGECAIYGDDLIVRRSLSDFVVRMLNLFGFTINHEKSFFEGPFRESCGADWYNGHNVRPVFLTETPKIITELWCDHNRIQKLLDSRGLIWDSKSCALLSSWIPEIFKEFVGPYSDEDFDSYKHVPLPNGRYRNGLWEFKTLTLSARVLNQGRNFLFRKLMSPLRPTADQSMLRFNRTSKSVYARRLSNVGNAFTVVDASSFTVSVSPTRTSVWSGEYTSSAVLITQ